MFLLYVFPTVCIKLLMVVSIVLERNPELEFQEKVDLDQLVKDAFIDFQRDRSRLEGVEKQVRLPTYGHAHTVIVNLHHWLP